ncbi:DUF1580 domain-containing protein [Gemmata massiliana]|uniref:DUF1580 domain-containing protein n=1 Tax=Gemmata massiliana TaxID=1210884 RepID=UPI0036F3A3DF
MWRVAVCQTRSAPCGVPRRCGTVPRSTEGLRRAVSHPRSGAGRPGSHLVARSGREGATKSHRTTVLRWITRGVSVRGVKVKLEAVRVGGKYVTSLEAYERFVTACSAGAGLAKPERTPAQMKRDAARADRELDRLMALK